ncbi:hypothetical protein C6P42_002836 [Pichia californica]|nr:hypothetical protein C6P42_002836 [[Candida] californica]
MSFSNTPRIRSSLSRETGDLTPHNIMEHIDNEMDENNNEHENDHENENDNENENENENDIDNQLEQTLSNTQSTPQGKEPDRKRKDNINQKIGELLQLIPQTFFSDTSEKSSGTKDGKPNKGQILSKGVDYITFLQNEIDARNRREVELTMLLNQSTHNKHTVAEEMLAKIGVGPLAEE